jgi:signal transduction histidine kinase/CheY-like chemotaxis protein
MIDIKEMRVVAMLKHFKILRGNPGLVTVMFLSLLPVPLLCTVAVFLYHSGVIGFAGLGAIMAGSVLISLVLHLAGLNRVGRSSNPSLIRSLQEENAHLEQQLIQTQKMEAIGTLAGGIAHDFNNVLSAIMGYVELAQLDLTPDSTIHNELNQVLKATNRAKDLVRQILTFSRKSEQDQKPLDPKPLVKEALTLLRATIPATIEIRHSFNTEGVLVMTNATQFHQVVMNLCTNAAQSMEHDGGILEVTLDRITLPSAAADGGNMAPGRYLELCVSDTGPGIATSIRQQIFDPFFTTKDQGKGSGMGLAVVHSIVQGHGGSVHLKDRPGTGACFCVRLPVTTQVADAAQDKAECLPRGNESVLYVDDEPVLVDLGKQMLRRLGYQVTCCQHSPDALALVQENPNRFDIVITDTTMPTMTGDVLAAKLLDLYPDLPVILCTGYSEQIIEERAAQMGISAYLLKPLAIGDLACTVRGVLDQSKANRSTPHLKLVPAR